MSVVAHAQGVSETSVCVASGRGRGRCCLRVVSWVVSVISVLWWGAYLASGWWHIADVALNGSVAVGIVLLVSGTVVAGLRRTRGSLVVWVVGASVLGMCLVGRRALPARGASDQTLVSVVSMNISMRNTHPDEVMAVLRGLDDDVVVLVEPRWEVFVSILDGRDGLKKYPYRVYRRSNPELLTSPMVILSRWPIDRDETVLAKDGMSVVVKRDDGIGGRFRVVGLHPLSPRTGERWASGNRTLKSLVERVGDLEGADGLRLVVAGDLNGGPMSVRDRILRDGLGVERCSAVFDPRSTFPSNVSMFGLLIDDIWVSAGFEAISWSTVDVPGSDHLGVRARLRGVEAK